MIRNIIIWIGFFILVLIMGYYSLEFPRHKVDGIVKLETAGQEKGKEILLSWQQTKVPQGNLLTTAKIITRYDFLFVIFYVSLLIMLSNDRMQREKWYPLNVLLRMNLPVAVLAGILDCLENGILLYNINHWEAGEPFISSFWFTWLKFILAGWAVLVWLVSYFKKMVS